MRSPLMAMSAGAGPRSGKTTVLGATLEILNASLTPPFQLDEYSEAGEDVRLKYRYLDLRRPEIQQRLRMRSRITSVARRYLEEQGFWDIESLLQSIGNS